MASETSERLKVTSEIFDYFKKEAIDGSPGGKFGPTFMLSLISFIPQFANFVCNAREVIVYLSTTDVHAYIIRPGTSLHFKSYMNICMWENLQWITIRN